MSSSSNSTSPPPPSPPPFHYAVDVPKPRRRDQRLHPGCSTGRGWERDGHRRGRGAAARADAATEVRAGRAASQASCGAWRGRRPWNRHRRLRIVDGGCNVVPRHRVFWEYNLYGNGKLGALGVQLIHNSIFFFYFLLQILAIIKLSMEYSICCC